MFGSKLIRTAEGVPAFHQLVREADFLNGRRLTCPPLSNNYPNLQIDQDHDNDRP